MKFKIYKEEVVSITSIVGKTIKSETRCYIYRSMFFGMIKIFLHFSEDWVINNREDSYWVVRYKPKFLATSFSEQEAEAMLKKMYSQPDKFVRLKE